MEKVDKTYYDRKIAYLDYFESGEKIKNGGFVRWEVKDNNCRIQIHIRGLYATDTLQGEILLLSEGETYVADMLQIRYGTGEYAGIWNRQALAGTQIPYEECDGICIKISESRMLRTQWRQRQPKIWQEQEVKEEPFAEVIQETEEEPIAEQKQEAVAETLAEVIQEAVEEPLAEVIQETENEPITEPKQEITQEPSAELKQEAVKAPIAELTGTTSSPQMSEREFRPDRISPDKWEQLNKIYPHIHPFGDSREYLSIKPRDFIIFSKKYQSLVQNSFLLHGYYNYGHVILARIKEREDESFYLGVPGVYYDREKQAALMFGFEGFESGCEYASDGRFGYYMKRVEI
ncbi:MAG: hypothetical protein IJ405_03565 [Lachnospiraceae bacterium]|nr:hypothetical protein [Lachnospiraceae bacterium]